MKLHILRASLPSKAVHPEKQKEGELNYCDFGLARWRRGRYVPQPNPTARVVEWQTRQLEGLVPARACGFDSHLEHHFSKLQDTLEFFF